MALGKKWINISNEEWKKLKEFVNNIHGYKWEILFILMISISTFTFAIIEIFL